MLLSGAHGHKGPRMSACFWRVPFLSLAVLLMAGPAHGVDVDGASNLYGAGRAAPPDPGGTGAGVLPPGVQLAPGVDRVVTFANATGTVDFGACCAPSPPDGDPSGTVVTPIYEGLAGPVLPRARHLSGVFLDSLEPMDPAPSGLVINDVSFSEIHPAVGQIFFVGDGLTDSGSQQVFHVPNDATRLFLGYIDCFPPCAVPGGYDDNSGSVSIGVEEGLAPTEVPALSTLAFPLLGSLMTVTGLLALRRSRED